ncbi:hypothetical protein PG997_009999 [Apiospora hydei]|uniref:Uncharacterized protein n=1 Tax=Apiospora hydei TaxID=1337664 RepID=A0ABR1VYB8_9PEZI
MAPTIVLVTGASRGLGRGIAQRFLAKPDHVVIAANHDPSGATTATMQDLPKGEGSRLITVKLDSAVETDAMEAVQTLQKQQPPIPNGAYGPTKAMVHWYTKRMNAEEPITAFVTDPGFPNTDMGSRAAGLLGLPRAPDDPDESCDGIVRAIEEATKETHGGKFIHYRGEVLPW